VSEESDPILVNDATFEAEVIHSRIPVVVDFFADWSVPSRATDPVLRELSQRLAGRVKFTKVNVDESSAVARSYGIHSIPTFLFVHGGQEKGREVGPVNSAELRSILKRHFAVEDRSRGGRAAPPGATRR
jgi:thioredoxin 1